MPQGFGFGAKSLKLEMLPGEFEKLLRKLNKFAPGSRTYINISRASLRAGSKPIRQAMKKNAPVGDGSGVSRNAGFSLKRSIRTKVDKPKNGVYQAAYTGVQYSRNRTAHWTEAGTTDRYHKSGKYTGRVEAQHWMERSFQAAIADARAQMAAKLEERLHQEMRKSG